MKYARDIFCGVVMMINSHVLDIEVSDEQASDLIESSISFDGWKKEMSKSDPWYIDIYNLFRYRIPYKIESFVDDIRASWQLLRQGYSDRDVWNMYVHISDLMDRMTADLTTQVHGHPPGITLDEWHSILDKIRSAFAKVVERDESGEFMTDDDMKDLDEAFDLLKKYFVYMWD